MQTSFRVNANSSDVIRVGRGAVIIFFRYKLKLVYDILIENKCINDIQVAIHGKYTTHKFYGSQISICRKCFV